VVVIDNTESTVMDNAAVILVLVTEVAVIVAVMLLPRLGGA
jgi:hypothetical protein